MKTRKKAAVEQRNGRWYAETTDSGCFGPFADKAEALAVLHPRRALWVFGLFWGAVLVLVTLLSLSAFGQTVANPTSGTVVPVSMSNIAPTEGSLAQALLAKFPLPPNGIIGGLLQQFSWTLNVNGTSYGCLFGNADASGAVNLSCVLSGSDGAPVPPASAPIVRVNQGVCGGLLIASEQATCPLGWTTTAGHFLGVEEVSNPGTSVTGVTASDGTHSYPMMQAVAYTTGKQPLYFYYLSNAPAGITAVTASFNQSNSSSATLIPVEYSGMSLAATFVSAAAMSTSGYVNMQTWTAGPYSVPEGALVLAGAASNAGKGAWSAGQGWTLTASYDGGAQTTYWVAPELMLEEQTPAAGSYVGVGSYAVSGYQFLDSFIVAFK